MPVKYHQPIRVKDIEVRWLPASHILGAAMIQLEDAGRHVLFTGDYSVSAQQTVPALGRPDFQADLVISEATYGERLHEDRNAAEERLLSQIREVVARGGRVLIPAFAVGRAQEVLLILKRAQRNGTPAGRCRCLSTAWSGPCAPSTASTSRTCHGTWPTRSGGRPIRSTPTRSSRSRGPRSGHAVLATQPCIIVASSGMLAGGPSLAYCQELVQNPQDAIFLTGYQDEESPGRALLDLARTGRPQGVEARPGDRSRRLWVRHLRTVRPRGPHADGRPSSRPWTRRPSCWCTATRVPRRPLARSLRCQDVIAAPGRADLRRDYPSRRGSDRRPAVPVPAAADLDIDRARHCLGPAGAAPVPAAAVAEAWFGQAVDRPRRRFARVLEVGRDWSAATTIAATACGCSASRRRTCFPEEAELEEQLKQANPKGRLLEFCMRDAASIRP